MAERLRIAQLAPIAGPVSPDAASSIEQLASLLTEEFARRGHDVTLFATGDSRTSASLRSAYARGYNHDHELWNYEFHEVMHAAAAFERADEFDVIHSHAYHYALPFARLTRTPVAHTYHINPNPDIVRSYARHPEARVVAVSRYHSGKFAPLPDVPVVLNGIDTDAFPFGSGGEDYLLFIGHLIEKKGAVEAIRVAREAGVRLVMAGQGGEYYRERVAPLVDGRFVEYVGPVGARERNALLAGAGALLFPINYSEPFGLVMIEAMACGTPVLATGRCAVPEIVKPGVTGYYEADAESLAARVPDALALDRVRIRREAVERWDYRRMADEYEALYRCMLRESSERGART